MKIEHSKTFIKHYNLSFEKKIKTLIFGEIL
jgi:hypothetical protein